MSKPYLKPQSSRGEKNANDEPNITGRGMGAPPTSRGKHTKNNLPDDDETTARTVLEGVDEAEQDDLRTAQKSHTSSQE